MFTRSGPFLALGALLLAGLAACESGAGDTAAKAPVAPPSAAPAVSATTTAAPGVSATSSAPAGGKTSGQPAPGGGAAANCPVSAATLLAAVKKEHPGWGEQELTEITCYRNFAISTRRAADPGADTEVQTFRYAGGAWHTFVGGSGGFCKGVPAEVTKYFRAHGRGGCES
ncbi:hypothetical protein GCM10020358_51430 [Amorphoplanes nipponensis]|uniref:Lipoprotein n=1 Tax=Actinoplanes nipponensis TaxID=135950 RepID=A0A919MMU5_9ACTN|nr:hypothetical protein [Actinoplanes nipponensis]GIE50901.1 hypothetical protein Ani05nite_44350 [Actinoplanes nipponensis]